MTFKGKKHSEETLIKMSESGKGHITLEETRKKISLSNKGRNAWNKGLKGYSTTWKGGKQSEKTKEKIGIKAKQREYWKGNKNPFYNSNRIGKDNPCWKGGRCYHGDGYILIYSPNHPYKTNAGYVMEHRLVMEKHIGRVLLPTEVVHHINEIRDDNRIENLMLFDGTGNHSKFHAKIRLKKEIINNGK